MRLQEIAGHAENFSCQAAPGPGQVRFLLVVVPLLRLITQTDFTSSLLTQLVNPVYAVRHMHSRVHVCMHLLTSPAGSGTLACNCKYKNECGYHRSLQNVSRSWRAWHDAWQSSRHFHQRSCLVWDRPMSAQTASGSPAIGWSCLHLWPSF